MTNQLRVKTATAFMEIGERLVPKDVNQIFNKIQKLSEKDQLSVMRRKIMLKNILFFDLPSDFPYSDSIT